MSPRSEEFMDQARDRLSMAREAGDYAAVTPAEDEARKYVEGAGEFIAAVEHMLAV